MRDGWRSMSPLWSFFIFVWVLKKVKRLLSFALFFFLPCQSFFCQTSSHLKKPPRKNLFLLASFSAIYVQPWGALLCNRFSRSFVTALSQHATCLTREKILSVFSDLPGGVLTQTFCQNKDEARITKQNALFVNCECNHGFVCTQLNASAQNVSE